MEFLLQQETSIQEIIMDFSKFRYELLPCLDNIIEMFEKLKNEHMIQENKSSTLEQDHIMTCKLSVTKLFHLSGQHRIIFNKITDSSRKLKTYFTQNLKEVRFSEMLTTEAANKELNIAILQDLYYKGFKASAENFKREARLKFSDWRRDLILDFVKAMKGIKINQFDDALNFVTARKDTYGDLASDIEFNLLQCKFLSILLKGKDFHNEAVLLSKRFHKFVDQHFSKIQNIMTYILYPERARDILPDMIHFTTSALRSNINKAFEIIVNNELETIFSVGCQVLPLLRTDYSKKSLVTKKSFSNNDEVFIDIELDRYYHTRFFCEFYKSVTDLKQNPAIALSCKHVFSQDGLKEDNNGTQCPLCRRPTHNQRLITF